MKYLSKLFLMITLSVAVLLTACDSPIFKGADTEFIKLLRDPSVKDINQTIHMEVYPMSPGLLTPGADVDVLIYNQSDNPVWFSLGAEAQIFLFSPENNQWEEIANKMHYSGEDAIIDTKEIGDFLHLSVSPDLQNNGKEQKLRVAATGYVMKDGQKTDEAVLAYEEFIVKPWSGSQ